MNVLLDTDHISILQYEDRAAATLQRRLAELPGEAVRVSIVSFQEQARGWLAYLHRARKREQVLKGYSDLQDLLKYYQAQEVMPFDESAMDEFMSFQEQRIRIGTSDLRIAAIARANGVKLLSRNLRDFRQVPNLDVEDWTV
jgi:tRNA(fMet)-specific endonuclease VapC